MRGESDALIQHPLAFRAVQRERRHVDFKAFAALVDHLVAAGHEAGGGRQRHAGGVFEALAGREHGLFADHAFAADFLLAPGCVGDDPMPGAELHGLGAGIDDHDRVGPEILAFLGRRAFGHEVRLGGNFDLTGDGTVHAKKFSKILSRIIPNKAGGTNRRTGQRGRLRWVSSRFQHSSVLKRSRVRLAPYLDAYLVCNLRADMIDFRTVPAQDSQLPKRCPMTSIADPVAGTPLDGAKVDTKAASNDAAAASSAPAIVF